MEFGGADYQAMVWFSLQDSVCISQKGLDLVQQGENFIRAQFGAISFQLCNVYTRIKTASELMVTKAIVLS